MSPSCTSKICQLTAWYRSEHLSLTCGIHKSHTLYFQLHGLYFHVIVWLQSDKVRSVQDALEQLVSKESLLGYTCTKSKVEVCRIHEIRNKENI